MKTNVSSLVFFNKYVLLYAIYIITGALGTDHN